MQTGLFFQRLALITLTGVLSACSIYSLPGQKPAPVEEPVYTEPGAASRTEPPGPGQPATPIDTGGVRSDDDHGVAYSALLQRAEQASGAGDYDTALALLERAQRIDPDSAAIYLAMAETHCARGDRVQCRATAERGLLYCTGRRQCQQLSDYAGQ